MIDQLLHELALLSIAVRLLLLHLENFFVDLVLEEGQSILIFAEKLGFFDQEPGSLLRSLEAVKVAKGLRQHDLEVILVRAALLRGY